MSQSNQISSSIPQDTIQQALNSLKNCKTLLAPYLQVITIEDRKTLFKLGDKTLATVQKTKAYLQSNPEFIPLYMDVNEFYKDEAVLAQLEPIANLADQLSSDINDTIMLAGSEALQAVLMYYGQIREASHKGVNSAKPIYDDLSQRFGKRTK